MCITTREDDFRKIGEVPGWVFEASDRNFKESKKIMQMRNSGQEEDDISTILLSLVILVSLTLWISYMHYIVIFALHLSSLR